MSITCADIPRLPGLESIIFKAGLTGGQRIVRWPYVAENDSIAPWVSGGELVFITGINHGRSEQNLCQLVMEAVNSNVAGLVILTGAEFIKHIPNKVLALANIHQIPILEQPYRLKMVLVTEVISNAIVQANLLGQSVRLFLTRLINGFDQAPELIHLRAADLGINENTTYATLALRLSDSGSELTGASLQFLHLHHELEQHLASLLKRRNIDWPVLDYQTDLLALWPVSAMDAITFYEELEQVRNTLSQHFPGFLLSIGVSERQSGLHQLADATEQARQALRFAVQHQKQRIFFYEQLGIARLYASIPNRRLLADFCKQHLGDFCFARVAATLEMKTTLQHYFNHFGHLQQTAHSMGLHRNTLSYRLTKIEQRLGYSLQDPFLRLNLQNALLIEQVLFHHHGIEERGKPD